MLGNALGKVKTLEFAGLLKLVQITAYYRVSDRYAATGEARWEGGATISEGSRGADYQIA